MFLPGAGVAGTESVIALVILGLKGVLGATSGTNEARATMLAM